MKYWIIIIISILVFSCNNNQLKPLASLTAGIAVPLVFVSKQSPRLAIKNDTVFLGANKFNGYLYSLYPDSNDTLSVESYATGILHGISKKWFSNKQLAEERNYQYGQKSGRQNGFWENGNKRFEFTAEKDFNQGVSREWMVNGMLFHLGNYENGQEEGKQQLWYENGKIRANYVIIKGRRYGLLGTKNCKNVSDSIFIVR